MAHLKKLATWKNNLIEQCPAVAMFNGPAVQQKRGEITERPLLFDGLGVIYRNKFSENHGWI